METLRKWALKLLTRKGEIVNPYWNFFYQPLVLISRRLKLCEILGDGSAPLRCLVRRHPCMIAGLT